MLNACRSCFLGTHKSVWMQSRLFVHVHVIRPSTHKIYFSIILSYIIAPWARRISLQHSWVRRSWVRRRWVRCSWVRHRWVRRSWVWCRRVWHEWVRLWWSLMLFNMLTLLLFVLQICHHTDCQQNNEMNPLLLCDDCDQAIHVGKAVCHLRFQLPKNFKRTPSIMSANSDSGNEDEAEAKQHL